MMRMWSVTVPALACVTPTGTCEYTRVLVPTLHQSAF